MLHEEFRRARVASRLTQSEVARRAGVPRKQVRALEEGANVTLATLRKIAAVLPDLRHVSLGGLEIGTANVDIRGARQAAHDLLEAAQRLVRALDVESGNASAGATRYDGTDSDQKRAAELEPFIDEDDDDSDDS